MYKVLFVTTRMSRVLMFVPLPPNKSGNFITLPLVPRTILRKVFQDRFRVANAVIMLLARVPIDRDRLGPLSQDKGDCR